eukprot:650140-Amorphochlora_amoeboformis.AAC.1
MGPKEKPKTRESILRAVGGHNFGTQDLYFSGGSSHVYCRNPESPDTWYAFSSLSPRRRNRH